MFTSKKKLNKKQQRAKQLRIHAIRQQIIIILALFGVGAYLMYHVILLGASFTMNPAKTIEQAQQQDR